LSAAVTGPGASGLHLVGGVPLLRPAEQAFEVMLDGWRAQRLARRLAYPTVEGRERVVRAFTAHTGAFPWEWTPQLVDEWMTDLRAVRRLRRSTLPHRSSSVGLQSPMTRTPGCQHRPSCGSDEHAQLGASPPPPASGPSALPSSTRPATEPLSRLPDRVRVPSCGPSAAVPQAAAPGGRAAGGSAGWGFGGSAEVAQCGPLLCP
jgi:hypothetical protein